MPITLLNNCIFFAWCIFIYTGIGFLLRPRLMFSSFLATWADALASGIAGSAIIVTFGYTFGATVPVLFVILTLGALIGIGRAISNAGGFCIRSRFQKILVPIATASVFAILQLLPSAIGGVQFTIFQGNHYDSFNYLEAAATFTHHSFAAITRLSPLEIFNAGGFQAAANYVRERPAVAILYGALSRIQPKAFLGNHYVYLLGFQFCALIVSAALVEQLAKNQRSVLTLICAGAVFLGFWGQYILDINAWSQCVWMPLAIALLLVPLKCSDPNLRTLIHFDEALFCMMLISFGAFCVYPEGCAFLSLPTIFFLFVIRAPRCPIRLRPAFIISMASLLAVSAPIIISNLFFLIRQSRQAFASVDWWTFFQRYVGGNDGFENSSWANLVDAVMGLSGFYFLTPHSDASWIYALSVRLGFGLFLLFLSTALIYTIIAKRVRVCWPLLGFIAVCAVQAFLLLLSRQYWSAGKGISFFLPIALIGFLALSLDALNWPKGRMAGFLFLALFVGGGFGFAVSRVIASGNSFGIHFNAPYPAIQIPALKSSFDYSDLGFLKGLRADDEVLIDIENPWLQSYAKMQLIANGISFHVAGVVFADRDSNRQLGIGAAGPPATKKICLLADPTHVRPLRIVCQLVR